MYFRAGKNVSLSYDLLKSLSLFVLNFLIAFALVRFRRKCSVVLCGVFLPVLCGSLLARPDSRLHVITTMWTLMFVPCTIFPSDILLSDVVLATTHLLSCIVYSLVTLKTK